MTTTTTAATLERLEDASLETRALELRAADDERREVRGIAVPWGDVANIAGVYLERFERGSLEPHAAGVKLYDHHGQIVGTVETRDTVEGLEIVGRVAKTRAGDDFLELVRSGAYGHLSIGFRPIEQRIEEREDDLPIVTRTRATLGEVSGVPFPAYAGATITEVRAAATAEPRKEHPMPETREREQEQEQEHYAAADELEELRGELTEMSRRMDTIGTGRTGAAAPSRFRTAGELLKALAAGDEQARAELRNVDYSFEQRDAGTAPATSALAIPDAGGPGWLSRPLRFKEERRRIVNIFDRAPLPADGNTVEYPKVASTSGAVQKQASEGSALAYMEVELDTGSATVGTYGGFSQLTRQAIERGNPAYLNAVFRFQAIQYAKATNLAARNAFLAISAGNTVTGPAATTFDAWTAPDWIAAVVDGAAAIEDTSLGLLADYLIVGRDVFKTIAALADANDRPIFALPNGGQAVNVAGSAAPVTAQFNIAGLPGFVDPGIPAGVVKLASSDAMTTLESPGAPFRLEDQSVVELTRDFSLYGYLATTENDANGVVDVVEGA